MANSGIRPRAVLTGIAVAALTATPALAQQFGGSEKPSRSITSVTATGDLTKSETQNPGRVQFGGGVELSNADYFRGRFDGVPEDFDELRVSPALDITFDMWRDGERSAALTIGTANSIWTDDVLPEDSDFGGWYESNNFVGISTNLGNDILAGATYTMYGSPNDVFETSHEVAFTGAYGGEIMGMSLMPQLKVAVPVDDNEGAFTQLGIEAFSFEHRAMDRSLTFSLPLAVGIGWSDYYGGDTDTTGYAQAGVHMAMPLSDTQDYGRWTLNAGVNAIAREDDLAESDPAVAGDDTVIYVGGVSVNFAY